MSLFPDPPSSWIHAHCDGGSRGNPGPSGYGAVITSPAGDTLAELSEFLGIRTNNFAEYSGLLAVLAWALEHHHTHVKVVSDSELMVKQIQGKYRVNSPDLKPLWQQARDSIAKLEKFEISHALRHKNKDADALANAAMDRGTNRKPSPVPPNRCPSAQTLSHRPRHASRLRQRRHHPSPRRSHTPRRHLRQSHPGVNRAHPHPAPDPAPDPAHDSGPPLAAQQAPPLPIAPPQSATVLTPEPLPLTTRDLLDRSSWTLFLDPLGPAASLYNSPVDLLDYDASLNLQQRAPNGVQVDLSLRGLTFEQTLVLVDGLRVNDPETGHLNFDISLPLEALSRIDILHGSGSTFFGSDAIGGAVDLITTAPTHASALLRLGGGSLNSTEQHLQLSAVTRRLATRLSASRDTSDGFFYNHQDDRGFHSNAAALDNFLSLTPNLGPTEILLAVSDRPYGANLFYGPYPSAERTKGWFAAIRQPLPAGFSSDFSYRRHTDEFILFVQSPSIYENNHIDSLWQADLRRLSTPRPNLDLAYGLEADGDAIRSNSLGKHARNQGAGYVNLSLRSLRRLTFSLGARQEIFAGPTAVFSSSASAGYDLSHGLRLHAAYGHGYRLPTYVDLFYSDPTTIGNPALKPETSQSYEAGLDWRGQGLLRKWEGRATAFTLRQSNAIDYSKYSAAAPYQATNVGQLAYSGVESGLKFQPTLAHELHFDYTFLHAAPPPTGLISEYAYNYASNKASFVYQGVFRQLAARTQLAVIQQTGRTAYPLWTVALTRARGTLRPYLRAENLANISYSQLPNVPQPGRTLIGGITLTWPSR